MKSTMVELVEELIILRDKEKNKDTIRCLNEMIEDAKAGEYHDYKNRKYDCGKVASHRLLYLLGFKELAARIASGEFDERADEEDIKRMREDGLENGLSEKVLKIFGL